MRAWVVVAAMAVAGCSQTQPAAIEEVAAIDQMISNAAPDLTVDNHPVAFMPVTCTPDDSRSECWVGKRGTPQRPCSHILGRLDDKVTRREVRAAPDAHPKLLGVLPGVSPGEDGRAVTFQIIDSRGGWLRIESAADDPGINGGVERKIYHGKGWIRGEQVSVSAQAEQGFAKPDFASAVVYQGEWFDGIKAEAILGCDGSWVKGRWPLAKDNAAKIRPEAIVSRDPLVIEAWVTGVCEIVETTCDGLSGNRPKP